MKKMKKKWKAKWIKALRSGKYEQGQHCLRQHPTNRFCCLGVLTDIANCKWIEPSDGNWYTASDGIYNTDQFIPPAICEKVGLPIAKMSDDDSKGVQNILASFNDDGDSFEEIATWIEENL